MVLSSWPVAPGSPYVAIPVSAEHDFASVVFTGIPHKQPSVSIGQGPDHPKGDETEGVGS